MSADEKLVRSAGDLETFLEMAREETNVAQRDSLLDEVTKELLATDSYVSELETKTLLAGESDVKPCGQPGFSWPYFDLGMDQNIEAFFFDAKLVGSGRDAGETAASREIRFTV